MGSLAEDAALARRVVSAPLIGATHALPLWRILASSQRGHSATLSYRFWVSSHARTTNNKQVTQHWIGRVDGVADVSVWFEVHDMVICALVHMKSILWNTSDYK